MCGASAVSESSGGCMGGVVGSEVKLVYNYKMYVVRGVP